MAEIDFDGFLTGEGSEDSHIRRPYERENYSGFQPHDPTAASDDDSDDDDDSGEIGREASDEEIRRIRRKKLARRNRRAA